MRRFRQARVGCPVALAVTVLAGCASGTTDRLAAAPVVVAGTPEQTLTSTTPKKLVRPLHFPAASRASCPESSGRYLQTPVLGSMTIGTGRVRVAINNVGNPHQGFHPAAFHGWLALKTQFIETPTYDGPFLVRARRLDRPGPIRIGSTPTSNAPLLVLGSTSNHGHPVGGPGSWRDIPYFTFVKSPGCYAWQIDGLTFSRTVVVRILTGYHP